MFSNRSNVTPMAAIASRHNLSFTTVYLAKRHIQDALCCAAAPHGGREPGLRWCQDLSRGYRYDIDMIYMYINVTKFILMYIYIYISYSSRYTQTESCNKVEFQLLCFCRTRTWDLGRNSPKHCTSDHWHAGFPNINLVGGLEHFVFFHISGIIIPID